MDTILLPISRKRHYLFYGVFLLFVFMLALAASTISTRTPDQMILAVLSAAVIGIIIAVTAVGINWRIGLYTIMFVIMWERWLLVTEKGGLTGTKIMIGITLIFMVFTILNHQLPRWWERLIDPLPLTAALFFLITLVSFIWTHAPEKSTEFLQRRGSVAILLMIVMIAVTNRDVLHRTIIWFVIGGTIVATISLSELVMGKSVLEVMGRASEITGTNTAGGWGNRTRIVGPSGDPPFWALAISAPGILLFGLFFYYRTWKKKALVLFSLLVVIINILSTGARAGAMSFVAGCAIIVLFCPIKHKVLKFGVAVGVSVLVTISLSLYTSSAAVRIADPTLATETLDYRVSNWYAAWDMYEAAPLTGAGVNSFQHRYPWHRLPGSDEDPIRVHNAFVQLLVESGVVGVVIYCLLYLFAALSVGCAALSTQDRRLKFEAVALFATMIGFFLFAGTSNVLENELYFLIFGLCGAAYGVARNENRNWRQLGDDFMEPAYPYQHMASLVAEQDARYPYGT